MCAISVRLENGYPFSVSGFGKSGGLGCLGTWRGIYAVRECGSAEANVSMGILLLGQTARFLYLAERGAEGCDVVVETPHIMHAIEPGINRIHA